MDAYTNDISKIGVPTILRRNHIQCYVDNISVRAGGAAKIATGEWARGNIEFTPSNYAGENAKDVPDATGAFDWGDRLYHPPRGQSPWILETRLPAASSALRARGLSPRVGGLSPWGWRTIFLRSVSLRRPKCAGTPHLLGETGALPVRRRRSLKKS